MGTINSGGNPQMKLVQKYLNKNTLDNIVQSILLMTPYNTDITQEQAYERLKSGKAKSLNEELFSISIRELNKRKATNQTICSFS